MPVERAGGVLIIEGNLIVVVRECPITGESHDCVSPRDRCSYYVWARDDVVLCNKENDDD